MFNNYEKKQKEVSKFAGVNNRIELDDDSKKDYKNIIIFSIFIFILILIIAIVFVFYYKNKTDEIFNIIDDDDDPVVFLPDDNNDDNKNNNQDNKNNSDLQAEKISLGQFYNEPSDELDFEIAITKLDLPINVKSDVVNYYDIARKVNLDNVLDKINNDGYAVIDNPFASEADNFHSVYKLLSEKNIPLLITDDYLIYYYQNNLKEIYKRIEKDVFYYSIWDASKKLFEVADGRYRDAVEVTGITNDPAIEGQRMYLAYLAVILELLSPDEGQISDKPNMSEMYFTTTEAKKFDFELPSYLYDDVLREIDSITRAKSVEKSPIFKYQKDYTSFQVPQNYEKKARLYNFYLATEWIRSVFPLYYNSEVCEDCLLDQDDWLISMVASSFMAKDLSQNQDIKNEWAKIYKIISFFSGLRQELTYLDYQEVLVDLYGEDYKLEELFTRENPDIINNALKLKIKLEQNIFTDTEGGYDRANIDELRKVGLRLLQETYLPDNYIYKDLTYPNVGEYLGERKNINRSGNATYCEKEHVAYRCSGIGLDIINLVNPIYDNPFFDENTRFENYISQSDRLRNDLMDLNKDDWHRNTFWLTLNLGMNIFNDKHRDVSLFFDNIGWKDRLIDVSLGSLLNLGLDEDSYELANKEIVALNTYKEKNEYSYIEPNIYLINELEASTKMLYDYLFNLNIMEEAVLLKSDLIRLQDNLASVKGFVEKELKKEDFDNRELQDVYNFLLEYDLVEEGEKVYQISLGSSRRKITRSIDGVKILIYVREINGIKAFVLGPVFDYQEY